MTEQITYTQPYEISTKVGAEVDSKGNIKPSTQVTIARKLDSKDEIDILIQADIERGIAAVTKAIDVIRGKVE